MTRNLLAELAELDRKREALKKEILAALGETPTAERKKFKLSAKGLAAIRKAQKMRWAKVKK